MADTEGAGSEGDRALSASEIATTPASGAASRSGAAPKQEVATVGMHLGRYELTDVLGEGGMATVFRARDGKLGREVAVKVMFPHLARRDDAVARFKREARAAAGLDHEHILRVFDVGGGEVESGNLVPPYIVLELVDGQSLAEYFAKREPPLAEVVAAIGWALCGALSQAHAQKIVHRDIKPANVMVTSEGRLALADFGVAHMGDDESLVTRTGMILGTPSFMSPEQALSDPVDSRSDLYSLGATLYMIATGSLPYSGSSAHILASILGGKCKSVEERNPAMGRELSRIIQGMMKVDPEERTASAKLAADALLEVVQGGGFEDAETLLSDYFNGGSPAADTRRKRAVSATLIRARKMAESGRIPMALSLADRVQNLDTGNLQAAALSNKFGRQRKQRIWPAVVFPMVVTAFVGILLWGSRPGSIAEYVDTEDARPRVSLLAHDAGTQPILTNSSPDAASPAADASIDKGTRTDDGKGSRKGVGDRGKRPGHRPPPVSIVDAGAGKVVASDAAPIAIPVAKKKATLVVDIKPWCNVWIDGVESGRASATKKISLAEGRYRVECKQPNTGLGWSKVVALKAGENRRLTGTVLGKIQITVGLSNSKSAVIDGRRVRSGGSMKVSIGRHRVELVVGGKASGKPVFLNLRQDCTLRDKSKLGCFSD